MRIPHKSSSMGTNWWTTLACLQKWLEFRPMALLKKLFYLRQKWENKTELSLENKKYLFKRNLSPFLKHLDTPAGIWRVWMEVALRTGGTFCQAKCESSLDKCYPGNSLFSFSHQKCQGDLCHPYESEDKLLLLPQAELCQTHSDSSVFCPHSWSWK